MAAAKTEMLLPALPISDPLSFPHPPMNNYPKLEETILINSAGTPFLIVSAPEGTSFGTGEAGDQYDLLTGVAGGGEEETEKRPFRRRNSKEGLPPNLDGDGENTEKRPFIRRNSKEGLPPTMGGVPPAPRLPELRIVLLGRTGVGKSAAGNTILGREEFESSICMSSVTQQCQRAKGEVDGRRVSVIDIPGLFDMCILDQDIIRETKESITLTVPGPHVFLLVLHLHKVTEDERDMMEVILNIFGQNIQKYTMVLFTHGDCLEGFTIEEYLQGSPERLDLIRHCHGGYHVFNNRNRHDRTQVTELLEKIDRMVERNGGSHYTSEMLQEAERTEGERELRAERVKEKECILM